MIPFVCPLCRQPLVPAANAWSCPARHSFDVAREGYVNLLPVQDKASRDPGDNPAMVAARRAFLEAGHYQALREAAVTLLAPLGAGRLVDLGCGEGYYTTALATAVAETVGVDIAKPAVRLAAKRSRAITWVVASGARLPLADAAVDAATSLFCRLHPAETRRVLTAGGHILVAGPAADHLRELRAELFDEVHPHEPDKTGTELADRFTQVVAHEVRHTLHLDQAGLRNLLAMTPYAWRARPERRAALEERESFTTEAVFDLRVFRAV